MKVAAAQFAVTNDVNDNLATCLRMIEQAASHQPDLIVLPEFCNHNSWYDDAEHCYQVSVALDGEFLGAIAQAAKSANAIVVINCTVRRDNNKVTGTSLMYSPEGELLGQTNKQVLIGHENDFLERATEQGPLIDTPFGKLAMYSCMDGVINETPRCLSLSGAQVLCNSLNSFAIDEGNLHIPVRAAENKVFVVAANKVGPLIPQEMLAPVAEAINIPEPFLHGAGDSQIVAPDGTVLAIAGKDEEVIVAEIDASQADNKTRPDGTDIYQARRPDLYQSLGEDPAGQPIPACEGAEDLQVAALGVSTLESAIEQIKVAQQQGCKLICLPELLSRDTDTLVTQVTQALEADTIVATTILSPHNGVLSHQGVLINQQGILLAQPQVHASKRFKDNNGGDAFNIVNTTFGKLAVLTEDDAIYPETFRLVAMQGAEVVMVPLNLQEAWLKDTGLTERAAENRVNVIAADKNAANNIICSLQKDFTLMTPWKERKFDGLLSAPEIIRGNDEISTTATIHPAAAENKVASHRTHLIENRPWKLMHAMLNH